MKNRITNYAAVYGLLFIAVVTFSSCSADKNEIYTEDTNEQLEPFDDDIGSLKMSSGRGNQTHILNAGANPRGSDGKCRPHGGKTGGFATRVIKGINRSSYNIRFEFKFHKNFDFDRGGKIGYGLNIGDGISGCRGNDSKKNKGGSFRIMWIGIDDPNTGACTVDNKTTTAANIIPYIYHRRMPGNCGDSFGKKFRIKRDVWYTVVMKFKANTGNKSNGIARVEIGEHGKRRTVLLNQKNMVWSYSGFTRNVTGVSYNIFRGGGGANWSSHKSGSVQIRKVQLDF